MTERKLASVQIVKDIVPIPGADLIECLTILGWQVVAKKGDFKTGEKCIYFEVDSFLPEKPEYEFLRKSSYRVLNNIGGFRLKTIKLKKQISQGLALPYSGDLPEGTDLTEQLGVVKWDPPIPASLTGLVRGNFPAFLTKTDEVRVQSEPELLDYLKDRPYYISTKLDGSSGTYYSHEGEFGVCSRNLELKETEKNSFWDIARRFELAKKLVEVDNICIQGEVCGPGIQKNPLGLKHIDFFMFNAYEIQPRRKLSLDEMLELAKKLELKTVPIEEKGEKFGYTIPELLKKAEGKYASGKPKEGIVVRSMDKPRVSFKVLNNQFLLKEE